MLELLEDLGMQYRGCTSKTRWYKVYCDRCEKDSIIRAQTFKKRDVCGNCGKRTGTQASNGKKICSVCGVKHDVSEFGPRKNSSDGYRGECKKCLSTAASKRWENSDSFRTKGIQRSRKNSLMKNYGLTIEEFNKMSEAVNHSCEICGIHVKNLYGATLHVDHCHESGKIRGLLCNLCNSGIGKLKDSVSMLQKAIDYLNLPRDHAKIIPEFKNDTCVAT